MMPFGHKDSVGTFPNHLAFPYDIVVSFFYIFVWAISMT